MEIVKSIGIKSLKNNLSAYIREVRQGSRILITDRDKVVAELKEPFLEELRDHKNPLFYQWVQESIIRPPLCSKSSCPVSPLKLNHGTSSSLIDEDRGE